MKFLFNQISIKLGLLFSGVFILLLLILGLVLYGVFTNLFVDYIKQDLLARGMNHAKVLENAFNEETIHHVLEAEKGVVTAVVITDNRQNMIGSSIKPDADMKQHLLSRNSKKISGFIEDNWREHQYIIAVTPIGKNDGYVYMYYPSYILRDIVFMMNMLLIVASVGIILLALGFIGILSRKLTRPLLTMKEATNKMSSGKYKQVIPVSGNDELSQLGKSIQLLGEQLQAFEDNRNEFLAAVSHELRTPLTYLKGYSDILAKGMIANPHEQQEYLKIINKEATRLSFLVNDLFEMSKLQVGSFQLTKEWTDIHPVIEKVILSLELAAANKGLSINFESQVEPPLVHIDVQRMEQVLYNLLENAVKYTNEGCITICTYLKQEFLVIEIKDTGIGIPPEELPRIWDRFYRVDPSRTRKTGGSGLGLYVVKNLVESHGGQIRVSSKENQGSTFAIFLKSKLLN